MGEECCGSKMEIVSISLNLDDESNFNKCHVLDDGKTCLCLCTDKSKCNLENVGDKNLISICCCKCCKSKKKTECCTENKATVSCCGKTEMPSVGQRKENKCCG